MKNLLVLLAFYSRGCYNFHRCAGQKGGRRPLQDDRDVRLLAGKGSPASCIGNDSVWGTAVSHRGDSRADSLFPDQTLTGSAIPFSVLAME